MGARAAAVFLAGIQVEKRGGGFPARAGIVGVAEHLERVAFQIVLYEYDSRGVQPSLRDWVL